MLKSTFLYLLFLTFLNGCTIDTKYYLRNFTDQEIVITFTSSDSNEIDFFKEGLKFYYKNEIKAISKKLYDELDQELTPSIISSDSLIVKVPSFSTVKFDIDHFNFVSYYFSSMTFENRGEQIEILFNPTINSEYPIEKKKIARFSYAAYIDIK